MLGMDLIGPLDETQEGNKYILTITDLWSKYFHAFPLQVMFENTFRICFFSFGPPEKISPDQGREFCNEQNTKLFSLFHVKYLVTLAHHPQTNGQDERTNQTLKGILSKLVNDKRDDWDQHLYTALFSIRTAVQSSTKYTPFFLMVGREARLFSELRHSDGDEEACGVHEFPNVNLSDEDIDTRLKAIYNVKKTIDDNIAKAQAKQKKYYDLKNSKGYKSFSFEVGMKVLMKNCRKRRRKGSRLEEDWLGPYEIHSFSSNFVELLHNGKVLKNKISVTH